MNKKELEAELKKFKVAIPNGATNKKLEELLAEAKKVPSTAPASVAGETIEGEGKFVVVAFKDGSRMYNADGQAVSPVETGQKEISKLARQCARSNALVGARTIKTPVGHKEE